MAGEALIFIGAGVLLLYIFQMIRYSSAIQKVTKDVPKLPVSSNHYVSMVVPLRNEIRSLELLLTDLKGQDYPAGLFEVIFVDDHSEDGSFEFLKEICRTEERYRVIRLEGQLSGKKQAVSAGCNISKGEWIIQTDADCRLPACFISEHALTAANSKLSFIAGPVMNLPVTGLWNRLESLEFMSLTGTGMASFIMERPVMCSGANISYSKAFYNMVSGDLLRIPSASGDDIFLMIQAKRRELNNTFLTNPACTVMTPPKGSPLSFLAQRLRWGGKAKYYRDIDLLYLSSLVWMANAVVTGFLIGSFFIPGFFLFFIGALGVKSAADFRLLFRTAIHFRRKDLLWPFPLAAIFYYFYITLAGPVSLMAQYSWKGRRYKR